jgi:glycosyltransferase involved in cell wall biosynthesis
MNRKKAAQMGANGRAFVRENFGWPTVLGKYHQVFEEIIKRNEKDL